MSQLQIHRTTLDRTRLVELDEDALRDGLPEGAALLHVDSCGLSANNVTYAVLGERLGYWQFFPAAPGPDIETETDWAVLPVWGFATGVASRSKAVEVGERLFGFLPGATHLVVRPEGAPGRGVVDTTEHRATLPRLYNRYERVTAPSTPDEDALRMLLQPLHLTSWAIAEHLADADFFGAEQVLVVSASSKTAIGLAQALVPQGSTDQERTRRLLALTSARNRDFVEGLGLYDEVLTYAEVEERLERRPSVIVDMSGSRSVLSGLHRHLGEEMRRSIHVGLTHWSDAAGSSFDSAEAGDGDLLRGRSETFFAPGVIADRVEQWGPAEFARRSEEFMAASLARSSRWLVVERHHGAETLPHLYAEILQGRSHPHAGHVVEL